MSLRIAYFINQYPKVSHGLSALLWALLRTLLTAPGHFFSALALALRMGRRAERPWPYHLVYLASGVPHAAVA